MAFVEQQLSANAADVAGPADDQNLHRPSWGASARRVKANRAASALGLLEAGDHPANHAMLSSWRQDLEALFLRTPLENIDVHPANAPTAHGRTTTSIAVERVGADQCAAVVVDFVSLARCGTLATGGQGIGLRRGSGAP